MMLLNGCVLIDGALGEIKTAAGWASHNTLAIWQGSPPGQLPSVHLATASMHAHVAQWLL